MKMKDNAFWPWKLDNFHAQIYSSIFIAIAVGVLVLLRAVAPVEFFTMGVTQLALSFLSITGVLIVDASAHKIDWRTSGTWLWIGGFVVLTALGAGMIWYSAAMGRPRAASAAASD
jgi:hypothetical protein